jgi:hypothetical protein
VNERLAEAGLGNPAIAIRNAMMTRIVLMIAREFSEPRETDRNLHRAVDLLSDATVRQIFSKNSEAIAEAEAHFRKCKGDNRLSEIRHFRDKYTAHIGEPKGTPLPKYKDLFSFANEMVDCIDLIAKATGTAVVKIADNNDAKEQAAAFWKPWTKESTRSNLGQLPETSDRASMAHAQRPVHPREVHQTAHHRRPRHLP